MVVMITFYDHSSVQEPPPILQTATVDPAEKMQSSCEYHYS